MTLTELIKEGPIQDENKNADRIDKEKNNFFISQPDIYSIDTEKII